MLCPFELINFRKRLVLQKYSCVLCSLEIFYNVNSIQSNQNKFIMFTLFEAAFSHSTRKGFFSPSEDQNFRNTLNTNMSLGRLLYLLMHSFLHPVCCLYPAILNVCVSCGEQDLDYLLWFYFAHQC